MLKGATESFFRVCLSQVPSRLPSTPRRTLDLPTRRLKHSKVWRSGGQRRAACTSATARPGCRMTVPPGHNGT